MVPSKMQLLCYCCDEVGTSVEHVPPQCLFPEAKDLSPGKDLRRSMITVPSCEKHNLHKSGDDEYLMYVLTMNLPVNAVAEHHFSTKIWRAIDRRPALINKMLEKAQPALVTEPKTGELFESLQFRVDESRSYRSLELIALGLYRHHFSKNWRQKIRVLPEFMRFSEIEDVHAHNANIEFISGNADLLFSKSKHFGENAEVFSYQVWDEQGLTPTVFRMHFYGGVKVLAFFERSDSSYLPDQGF